MKARLLFCLLFFASLSYAQEQRVHFTDKANEWKVMVSGGGTEYWETLYTFTYLPTDTLFNGRLYQRLATDARMLLPLNGNPEDLGAGHFGFREDTAGQQVFGVDMRDSSETVIYNGAWAVGDSVQSGPYFAAQGYPSQYYIRAVDSAKMDGEWYRVYHLNRFRAATHPAQSTDAYSIMEGVGPTAWPAFTVEPRIDYSAGEYGIVLRCFSRQHTTYPVSPSVYTGAASYRRNFDNAVSCTSLGITSHAEQQQTVRVIPSPANDHAMVTFSAPITKGSLVISDVTGRIVCSLTIRGDRHIPIGNLIPGSGVYFLKVTDTDKGKYYPARFYFK